MSIDSRWEDGAEHFRLLLAVGRDRDTEAFRMLFEFFAPRLRAFVSKPGADRSVIEDVVQETFVNIWRKAHLYDPEKASASTWIYTVARNARIDFLRKAVRPAVDLTDPVLAVDPIQNPQQQLSQAEEGVRLQRAIASLPDEQREVLKLAFFADLAHAEIAKELKLPLGTVKSRIRLALGRMRMEFGEDES